MSIFHKIFYITGVCLKNAEVIKKYRFLKKTEKWNRAQIEAYQLSQINKLLSNAVSNSEYYKEKYKNIDFRIDSLDDLKKLPTLSKFELLKFNTDIHTKTNDKLIFSETSGSTGEPLIFYRNKEWDGGHRAAQLRGYSWHDIKPWNKNGYFWGYDFSNKSIIKIKFLDFLLNRHRIFSYKEKDIKKFTKKLKSSQYVEGYSSMIYEVAKSMNKKEQKILNLKMIKGTSEKIYDHYQDEVKKAFGKKMISEYGAAEAGIIAFECKYNNMHITEENVIVEEVNGEILVTNLLSSSFPIIRYKLGDNIVLNKSTECKCGLKHYIIEEITGRIGNPVYGYSEQYPSLTFYYIFKNLAVKHNLKFNYQVVQRIQGQLILSLEEEVNVEEKNLILKEFKEYFNNDIKIVFNENKLIRDYKSKVKDFISYL